MNDTDPGTPSSNGPATAASDHSDRDERDAPGRAPLEDGLAAVAADFGRSMELIYGSVTTAFRGYGASTRMVVDYFAENPDILAVLVRAVEHSGTTCHCFCQWRHAGSCDRVATTTRLRGGHHLPFCTSCARAVDIRSGRPLDQLPMPPVDRIGS